jgi:hypothetical protein
MTKSLAAVVAVVGLVSQSGCSCGPQTTKREPKIELLDAEGAPRASVDFGQVQLNVTAAQSVRVRNAGAGALTISGVTFSRPVFGLGATPPLVIAAGDEALLPLNFTPTTADLRETGTASIASDDPSSPTVALTLAGTGVTAVATVMPSALAFGEVYVGESKAITVTLTNSGSNDLEVKAARLSAAVPPSVTGALSSLVKTLKAGEAASATLTFAPLAGDVLAGALEIELPGELGTTTVPVSGKGIQALPRLCAKWDDTGLESCTDQALTFLQVPAGSLCDARLYPPDGGPSPCLDLDGGRAPYERRGRVYFRNEGNTPVTYTLLYQTQVGSTCDGGSTVDFEFANAPPAGDGGAQTFWMEANVKVPATVNDPRPWETAPVTLVYRPRSGCREDAADQARMLWTRQGEPLGSARMPQTLIANFTGQSLLPRGVPQDITMSGTVTLSADFYGVGNAGDAPLVVQSVGLWQPEFLVDGGRGTTPFEQCDELSTGDCRFFHWSTDGGNPSARLPLTLSGTTNTSVPTRQVLGRLQFGPAPDGGVSPQLNKDYGVLAVIQTSDPYLPQVIARVRGVAR